MPSRKKLTTRQGKNRLAKAVLTSATAPVLSFGLNRTVPARKRVRTRTSGGNKGQGMNWISQDKRLACYLRDGCACAFCGKAIEDGAKLTLDHIVPRSQHGGSISDEGNLITACHDCNSRRGDRNIGDFARAVAAYVNHGTTAENILSAILEMSGRDLKPFRAQAKQLIALRGSAAKVLAAL